MSAAAAPIEQNELVDARGRIESVANVLQLPLRMQVWRGMAGNWAGAGVGSSIDFQDHRPYIPGDDPRYIDWNAYARTGHYSMKLYREEVSPLVDLVVDASASMWWDPAKRSRGLELLMFCAESALQAGASLRAYALSEGRAVILPVELLRSCRAELLPKPVGDRIAPRLDEVPWRQGSLRVWISDLLFPGDPELALNLLAHAKGRGLVLAPFALSESDPEWLGNLEMESTEAPGPKRQQRVDPNLLSKYRARYRRHFDLWQASSRRLGIRFARVPCEGSMQEALHFEAVGSGAVELRV